MLPALFGGEDEATGPGFLEELGPEAVSPLAVLDDDLVDQLTENQQKFLLARMAMSTDVAAAKYIGIQRENVVRWKQESESFVRAYKVIRSDPVKFALLVNRQIVQRAAIEHMQLLRHPNIRVRQWAIDLAYRNQGMGKEKVDTGEGGDMTNFFLIMQRLVREAPKEPNADVLDQPFEGDYTTLDGGTVAEEGRVDQVREES